MHLYFLCTISSINIRKEFSHNECYSWSQTHSLCLVLSFIFNLSIDCVNEQVAALTILFYVWQPIFRSGNTTSNFVGGISCDVGKCKGKRWIQKKINGIQFQACCAVPFKILRAINLLPNVKQNFSLKTSLGFLPARINGNESKVGY